MDYSIKDLEIWNEKIEEAALEVGLDYYPQEFEIVNYNEMLGYESYVGMPSRYPHWSFGKQYERLKTLYNYNLTGLPYEMVINSNPCLAYLLKDNTLLLQILTIAHVYGHNDFFKNNRMFKEGTDAEYTLEMFKNHSNTVKTYINDPSIGYEEVESIINAAHSIKYQVRRSLGFKRIDEEKQKQMLMDNYKELTSVHDLLKANIKIDPPDINKVPLNPEDDLIYFITQHGEMEDWQRNVLEVVRKEAEYFVPQIETKIMNEGWASYWHFHLLNKLDLPPSLHLEFLKRHNDVLRPILGGLNPYHLGFEMFCDLEKRFGVEKIFEIREFDRDSSFIRRYLTLDMCKKINLFEYVKNNNDYSISEVSDEEGWEEIRNTLADTTGMGSIPYIRVVDMSKKDKTLTLEHVYDDRELNINYAHETLKSIYSLWKHKVVLNTKQNKKDISIVCDNGNILK